MSFSNYSNMASSMAQETATNQTPQWSDIVNYKDEFIKSSLQGVGSLTVGQKGIEALKVLRAKVKGSNMEKYGFNDKDLADIQESIESGDMSGAISKLGSKLTSKLTDAGRNALGKIKGKITDLKNQSQDTLDALGDAQAKVMSSTPTSTTNTIAKPAQARQQIDDDPDIAQAESGEDLIAPINRSIARYNNLDSQAQSRVNTEYNANKGTTSQPDQNIGELQEGSDDLQTVKDNIQLRNTAIKNQETNPQTSFKDPDFQMNPANDAEYLNKTNPLKPQPQIKNSSTYDNPDETENVVSTSQGTEADISNLVSKASNVEKIGSKVSSGLDEATEGLAGLTEASTALDWNPAGWLLTAGAGIATLIGGMEVKAHHEKFLKPPLKITSYSEQADV